LFGVGDADAVVNAQLSDGAVDGLLVGFVGTRRGDAGVELRDERLVATQASPAAGVVAVAEVDAGHAVVPLRASKR
jgi:hypothetical protein